MSDSNELTNLVQDIKTANAIVVSVVSYAPVTNTYSAAWISETDDQWVTAIISMSSNDKSHGGYRAEYSGMIWILTALNILWKRYSITQGLISLGCDGLSVL